MSSLDAFMRSHARAGKLVATAITRNAHQTEHQSVRIAHHVSLSTSNPVKNDLPTNRPSNTEWNIQHFWP